VDKFDWGQVGSAIAGILNGFVNTSLFLEHTLGYGIGYPVFVLLSILAALLWPIARWADKVKPRDGSQGISSEQAQAQTHWHFLIAFILCAAIDGYVYFHGGVLHHS
jgi:hypothetical protein